jgi:hypothetical protein
MDCLCFYVLYPFACTGPPSQCALYHARHYSMESHRSCIYLLLYDGSSPLSSSILIDIRNSSSDRLVLGYTGDSRGTLLLLPSSVAHSVLVQILPYRSSSEYRHGTLLWNMYAPDGTLVLLCLLWSISVGWWSAPILGILDGPPCTHLTGWSPFRL